MIRAVRDPNDGSASPHPCRTSARREPGTLARCTADVDVKPGAPLKIVVTFVPDPASFRATCTVDLRAT
jgi:hypothetical protein